MINNYYTIREIMREARSLLTDARVSECYTQERRRLVLTATRGAEKKSMIVSCMPRINFIYVRDVIHRARKNTFDTLAGIKNQVIEKIELHPGDRQVSITMKEGGGVIIQLFGARSNVYLIDDKNIISDSFLRTGELVGRSIDQPKTSAEVPSSYESFTNTVFADTRQTLKESLKSSLYLFGAVLHREIAVRSGIALETVIKSISETSRAELWNAYIEIMEELSAPEPRIYFEGDVPLEMGLIHLAQYYGKSERPFASPSDAVRTFVNIGFKHRSIGDEKKEIERRLNNEKNKSERTLVAIRAEIAGEDRSRRYEYLGNLLMANPHLETKGKQKVEVEDMQDANRIVIIDVDPKLTVIKNAERYFDRARKARLSRREAERRVKSVERRLAELGSLIEKLGDADDQRGLKSFFRNNMKQLSSIGMRMSKDTKEELPFRLFRVAGDYEVWAGKSSANNDLLTMKYAKPNDLWFHARGSSGSHVVLRTGGSRDTVPREAVEQAASIAAYYSKMKTARFVPVAMTEKKYVRKRKGDPPGTVILSREKVIMAEPRLPDSRDEE